MFCWICDDISLALLRSWRHRLISNYCALFASSSSARTDNLILTRKRGLLTWFKLFTHWIILHKFKFLNGAPFLFPGKGPSRDKIRIVHAVVPATLPCRTIGPSDSGAIRHRVQKGWGTIMNPEINKLDEETEELLFKTAAASPAPRHYFLDYHNVVTIIL